MKGSSNIKCKRGAITEQVERYLPCLMKMSGGGGGGGGGILSYTIIFEESLCPTIEETGVSGGFCLSPLRMVDPLITTS